MQDAAASVLPSLNHLLPLPVIFFPLPEHPCEQEQGQAIVQSSLYIDSLQGIEYANLEVQLMNMSIIVACMGLIRANQG